MIYAILSCFMHNKPILRIGFDYKGTKKYAYMQIFSRFFNKRE